MSLVVDEKGNATLNKARLLVCLEATWEIEAIALMLPDTVAISDEDSKQSQLRVRCMAGRLRELANALMVGLGDVGVPIEGLRGLNSQVLLCDEAAS